MSIPGYDVTDLALEHIRLLAIERRAQDRRIQLAGSLPEGIACDRRKSPGRRAQDSRPDPRAALASVPFTPRIQAV